MEQIKFYCLDSGTDTASKPCTPEWLDSQLDSPKVGRLIQEYRLGDESKKRILPALLPQAYFPLGDRLKVNAKPSGLLMLDIDDHDGTFGFDPRSHYEQYIAPRLDGDLSHVLMVHVTPSGCGMRVIAKRQHCGTLLDEQQELFAKLQGSLPVEAFDRSCHDLSRLSYLTTREDLLYLNRDELFGGEVAEGFSREQSGTLVPTDADCTVHAAPMAATDAAAADTTGQLPILPEVQKQISEDGLFYQDVPYNDIVNELMRADGITIRKGNRNKSIFRLACQMRGICRSEEHLKQILPQVGLPAAELSATVHSACQGMTEGDVLDSTLKHVLSVLVDAEQPDAAIEPPLPKHLPKALQTIIDPFPVSHRPALLICSLPPLGTLGTNIRARYLDSEVHSPSFQVVLMGEQGSGKSSMSILNKRLTVKLRSNDEVARKKMDEWRDECSGCADGKGPRVPHNPIRVMNPKTTFPTFIDMMKNARGKHLSVCAPEIDSLPANEWLQHGSTLRLAFDNEFGGQDTKSATATSGYLPFMINASFSGTPNAVMKHFRNVEDGIVSRTIFATLPDARGLKREKVRARTAANEKRMDEIIDTLMNYGEHDPKEREPLHLPKIEKAMMDFYDAKGDLYKMTMNEGIEVFRTRAAVIGFRAGALAYVLEGKRESKAAIDFAIWVAEYTLYNQVKIFGQRLQEAVDSNRLLLKGKALSTNDFFFIELPEDFTNTDVAKIFQSQGMRGSGVSQTCRRWEDSCWVVRRSRGKWSKTPLGIERAELLRQSVNFPSVVNEQIAVRAEAM